MAKQWQLRRGTTVENDDFTGAVGEVTVDTVTHELRVHDGSAEGGYIVGETSKQVLNQNTLSTTEKVKTWMGSEAEYVSQDIENEHPDYVCYITDDEPADSQEYNLITYPMRNVGDVFFTSRLDTELNGAVECDGSTYYLSNYQGVDSIYNLFTLGKLEYISMSDYTAAITAKGWCDKFGWDGEGNDTFKVPTLTAKVIQENNIPVIGNGKGVSFMNNRGTWGLANDADQAGNAWSASSINVGGSIGSSANRAYPEDGNTIFGLSTDSTKSGMIADLSSDSANLRVMVQLAEACLDDTIEKNSYDLFDVKWIDHTIKNIAWARADTFDWKDGRIYTTAYNHLKNDYDNIEKATYYFWVNSGHDDRYCWTESRYPEIGDTIYYDLNDLSLIGEVTAYDSSEDGISFTYDGHNWTAVYSEETQIGIETETISGITIEYYLAEDGHKIVLPDQESNVSSIYAATGIAWYYILDIENERFKLPRTKFAFAGIRDTVGNYIAPGLPNITGYINKVFAETSASTNGAFKLSDNYSQNNWAAGTVSRGWKLSIDASKSNSVYGNSITVQSPATQMYLYFYLGEFTTTSLKNAATLNIETLNKKVEKGHEVVEFQVPTAENDYTWVRKYADGWVEQGGYSAYSSGVTRTVVFPVEMADIHYCANATILGYTANAEYSIAVGNRTTTGFDIGCWYNTSTALQQGVSWEVKGMVA